MPRSKAKTISPTNTLHHQRVRVESGADLHFVFETFIVLIIILFVVSAYIWSRLEVVRYGYDIPIVTKERSILEEENKRLRLKVMALRSPKRIEKIVMGEMGLTYPSREDIIHIQ